MALDCPSYWKWGVLLGIEIALFMGRHSNFNDFVLYTEGVFMNLTRTASYWTVAVVATLLVTIGSAFAQEKPLHICEELMRQEHTEADMKKCIEEFGEPESFKQAREQRQANEQAQARDQEERSKYFDKTFNASELKRFGAPYVAKRNYYDVYGRIYKRKTLTEAKDLCKYLGFDKALGDGALSAEMEDFENRNFVGVVVDDPIFGSLSAEQFRFKEVEDPSNIQVYTSLTCRRDRKEGDPESATVNAVNAVNADIREGQSSNQEVRQDNSSRRQRPVITEDSPYLYNPNRSSQR